MSTPRAGGQSPVARRPIILAALLGAAIATAVLACGPGPGASPTGMASPDVDAGPTTYTLCPPGDAPPPDANATLLDVVEARLAALGIVGATVMLGACLDVALPGDADEVELRAALFASGLPQIMAVPAELVEDARPGSPPPDGLIALADSTGVLGASTDPGGASVALRLTDEAAALIASWVAGHPDDAIVLVVDERIVGLAEPTGAASEAVIRFTIPADSGVSAAVVAALLESGPLPGDWRQPAAPQG